jgi:hypothetical protein
MTNCVYCDIIIRIKIILAIFRFIFIKKIYKIMILVIDMPTLLPMPLYIIKINIYSYLCLNLVLYDLM